MRKLLQTIKNRECIKSNLNFGCKQLTIQLSISIVLVFFGWFFILPTNVCSYAYILSKAFHVTDSLFIILSNCAGLLGLIIGGVFAVLFTKMKKLLLSLLCVLNLFNIMIFVVPPQVGLFLMISQYFMLGIYTALATYLFFINTMNSKRYIFTGSILASIIFITAFFNQSTEGVTAQSVFSMNLIISGVVLVIVVVLNLVKDQPQEFKPILITGKPVLRAFLLLCVYSFILSFSLGYLSNESEFILASNGVFSSILNVFPYIGTIILVLSLPIRRFHMGIITYVANALMIIAIAYIDFFNSQTALSGVVNVMLYFAVAINQLFILDTSMELSKNARNPSIAISAGLLVFVLGSALGDHFGEMIIIKSTNSIDRLLISAIAFASMILPFLRILLSKHSTTSIFRINPVAVANLPAAETTDQVQLNVPIPDFDFTKVYPQVENYNALTRREKEILDLLIKGYPSEVICSTLFISSNTLKRHVQNIYNKLNVHSRAELFKLLHKT